MESKAIVKDQREEAGSNYERRDFEKKHHQAVDHIKAQKAVYPTIDDLQRDVVDFMNEGLETPLIHHNFEKKNHFLIVGCLYCKKFSLEFSYEKDMRGDQIIDGRNFKFNRCRHGKNHDNTKSH